MPLRLIIAILLILKSTLLHADVQDDLKGVKSQIREKQIKLKQTKKVEKKVSSELLVIEKNLKEKEQTLAHLHHELEAVEDRTKKTNTQIQDKISELDRKKDQINKRIASVYKAGDMGGVRIFFSSGSIPQVMENFRYMRSVLEHDRKLFEDYKNKLGELQQLKDFLEKEAFKKEKLSEKIRLKKQEIESEKSLKTQHLSQVRVEKKAYQTSLKELQANASRLQSMVERLEARSRKSYTNLNEKKVPVQGKYAQPPVSDTGFGSQRGRLTLPVKGSVVSRFGKHKHTEFNAFTFNNGISISAPLNSDIKAVYDGVVIFAERFKGYGNMVIVDHGGGYFTLYAHAASILKRVGSKVTKNESVALVGDSDSPSGSQLYFEIRYQGKPVDPSPWLKL